MFRQLNLKIEISTDKGIKCWSQKLNNHDLKKLEYEESLLLFRNSIDQLKNAILEDIASEIEDHEESHPGNVSKSHPGNIVELVNYKIEKGE